MTFLRLLLAVTFKKEYYKKNTLSDCKIKTYFTTYDRNLNRRKHTYKIQEDDIFKNDTHTIPEGKLTGRPKRITKLWSRDSSLIISSEDGRT
jgi:hypothetical protein